jgi:hypothetical protein
MCKKWENKKYLILYYFKISLNNSMLILNKLIYKSFYEKQKINLQNIIILQMYEIITNENFGFCN